MSLQFGILLLFMHFTKCVIISLNDNETTIMQKLSTVQCESLHTCQDYHTRLDYIKERNQYSTEFSCFCDSFCLYFNDCCPDASPNPDDLLPGLEKSTLDLITCKKIKHVNRFSYIYFVNKCPTSWHGNATRTLCEGSTTNREDITINTPVTGTKTGLMYRNMYCAMCHDTDYLFWKMKMECESSMPYFSNLTFQDLLDDPDSGCRFQYRPPEPGIDYRMCLTDYHMMKRTCHPDFNISKIRNLCELSKSMSMYYSSAGESKNEFCAVCNFASRIWCSSFIISPWEPPDRYYPFTMLLDINTGSGVTTIGDRYDTVSRNITNVHSCDTDEVFNPNVMSCTKIVCEESFILVDRRCVSNTSTSQVVHCFRIELVSSEYEILKNGDLVELLSGNVYAQSEFYIKNTSAFVCSNLTQNYTFTQLIDELVITFDFSPAQIFITLTGLSISLVALCITIIIYSCIGKLQNTPGKNLLSLSCALFLAELLMIIGPELSIFPQVCRVAAILMHYFFLAAFFWMSVMAADVWVTFTKSFVKVGVHGKSSKRFLGYSIISWCGPALIVIASLTVEYMASSPTFKPNYGKGICWLTNKNALLLFFAGPLFLIILVNTGFFFGTASGIYRSKASSAQQLGSEDNIDIAIYVKLFLVMGLTWVVGFVAAMVSHPVLWYLFIVFNTLQGLFIFLGFVMTRKVRRLVRERVFGSKQSLASRSFKRSEDTSTKVVSVDSTSRVKESFTID